MIPVTPRTVPKLIEWCRLYQQGGTVPQPKHIRFGIGIYQITQGMSWHISSPVRWQSFCAAAMHFTMCAEAYGLSLEPWLPDTLAEISDHTGSEPWRDLLLSVGKAQQQIIYKLAEESSRKSRFKPEDLRFHLMTLVENCFAMTPPDYREQGCFDEMHIILGDIVRK